MVEIELAARLALGEVELASSPGAAAGAERLRALRREAADRGFGLISARVDELLRAAGRL